MGNEVMSEETLALVNKGLEEARNGQFVESPKNAELINQQNEVADAAYDNSAENRAEAHEQTDDIDAFLDSVPDTQVAPEDMLAAFYERHLNAVKHDIELLGKNALKRVLLNVMMGEFAPQEYRPKMSTKTGKAEQSIAFHFNEGVEKRMLLRFEMEFGKAQEAYEKEMADLKTIEEMNKLTPEAQAILDDLNTKGLDTLLAQTQNEGENNG